MSKEKPTVSYESFDWDQLDKYLQFKPTLTMTAELMECGKTTIKSYIKKKHNLTYTEYADIKLTNTKLKLVQQAIKMALSGKNNVMMIFCLKNICKWTDTPDPEGGDQEDLEFI